MRRALPAILVIGCLAFASTAFTPPNYAVLGQRKGPAQPIKFSHKLHTNKLGIDCLYCHYAAIKSPIANIPAVSVCMGCHKIAVTDRPEIQKLTGYANRGEVIPWVEVYKLPQHVKFNHKRHVLAGVQCMDCHGPVKEMDVMVQYPSLKMGWCVSCHRKNMNDPKFPATMDCVVCHH